MVLERILASSLLFVAVLFSMGSTATAATLNVVGGQLLGASGVIVDGSSYNVEFLDDSCIALYAGCDDVSDFTFQSSSAAGLAAQALLDQVFLDGPDLFDTDPELTAGCSLTSFCNAVTPYIVTGGFVDAFVASNFSGSDSTIDVDNWAIPSDSLNDNVGSVYAVWSPVPEPGTAVLMGLGLVALSVRKRQEV